MKRYNSTVSTAYHEPNTFRHIRFGQRQWQPSAVSRPRDLQFERQLALRPARVRGIPASLWRMHNVMVLGQACREPEPETVVRSKAKTRENRQCPHIWYSSSTRGSVVVVMVVPYMMGLNDLDQTFHLIKGCCEMAGEHTTAPDAFHIPKVITQFLVGDTHEILVSESMIGEAIAAASKLLFMSTTKLSHRPGMPHSLCLSVSSTAVVPNGDMNRSPAFQVWGRELGSLIDQE